MATKAEEKTKKEQKWRAGSHHGVFEFFSYICLNKNLSVLLNKNKISKAFAWTLLLKVNVFSSCCSVMCLTSKLINPCSPLTYC